MSTRTTSATVDTNTAKPITSPTWLVAIHWPVPDDLYLTSRGPVPIVFDGYSFDVLGVAVNSLADHDATFVVRNYDNLITALVSAHGANDIPVSIYTYYETDGVLLMAGFLDGVRFQNHEARFRVTRLPAGSSSFPERIFHRGQFPYMPSAETVIRWNGAEYTLRGRR